MSKEKKALAATDYGNATPDSEETLAAEMKIGAVADSEDHGASRGQNLDVLPGILGRQLRSAYGELLNSPVPERFNDLIKQLQKRENEEAASSTPSDKEAK